MNPNELIINPRTGLLRAGWRAAIFIALLSLPYLIYRLLPKNVETSPVAAPIVAVDVSPGMILTYAVMIAWVASVSWICLRFLERMRLSALGFALREGWFGDVLKGCAIGGMMIASVVTLQIAGRGSRLSFNPILRGEQGGINLAGVRTVAAEMVAAL